MGTRGQLCGFYDDCLELKISSANTLGFIPQISAFFFKTEVIYTLYLIYSFYTLDSCVKCGHVVATHLHEFWVESGYQVPFFVHVPKPLELFQTHMGQFLF